MLILIMLILVAQAEAQSCLDDSGNKVDWWIILKLPLDSVENPSGKEYLYCDSDNNCDDLEWITDLVDDPALSPLEITFAQIDFNDRKVLSTLWSDQSDAHLSSTKGHSKGILSASMTDAFIIQHSAPHYPMIDPTNKKIKRGLPHSAVKFGQHFYCASLTTADAETLAAQLVIAGIVSYKSTDAISFQFAFPNLYSLQDNSRTVVKYSDAVPIAAGGLKIMVFAKNEKQLSDFYEDISKFTKFGFAMETWGSGHPGQQAADCTGFKTFSVLERIHYEFRFSYTKDHSKFGISIDSQNPAICFSDLNRMVSQNKRGGIAMCFENIRLWNILNNAFVNRQGC